METRIRKYRPKDLDAIKQITVEAFEGVSIDRNIEDRFGEINGHNWRWRKARHIDDDVAAHADGTFVAEREQKIVGYITTRVDHEAGVGLIPNLAVDESCRGQGLGRRLIQFALDYFRDEGLTHARIETLDQNSIGQTLYPDCGFQEVARQIHYCMALAGESQGGRGS